MAAAYKLAAGSEVSNETTEYVEVTVILQGTALADTYPGVGDNISTAPTSITWDATFYADCALFAEPSAVSVQRIRYATVSKLGYRIVYRGDRLAV